MLKKMIKKKNDAVLARGESTAMGCLATSKRKILTEKSVIFVGIVSSNKDPGNILRNRRPQSLKGQRK